MIVVTGMHRSGTTFVGDLLKASRKYHYVHEPFNLEFGMKGVPCWYPDLHGTDQSLDKLFEDLTSMSFRPRRSGRGGSLGVRFRSRLHLPSRLGRDLLRYRASFRAREILVKDPFLSLSAERLLVLHPNVRVVYVVRHPVAVYESLLRMHWSLSWMNSHSSNRPLWENLAILWCRIYTEASRLAAHHPSVMLLRHEDLCMDPDAAASKLAAFAGCGFEPSMRRYVNVHTRRDIVAPQSSRLHVNKRNSKLLAWSWHEHPKPEHDAIINACKSVLRRYYVEDAASDDR